MKKYEYNTINCHSVDLAAEADAWGQDGWRVVHVEYVETNRAVVLVEKETSER